MRIVHATTQRQKMSAVRGIVSSAEGHVLEDVILQTTMELAKEASSQRKKKGRLENVTDIAKWIKWFFETADNATIDTIEQFVQKKKCDKSNVERMVCETCTVDPAPQWFHMSEDDSIENCENSKVRPSTQNVGIINHLSARRNKHQKRQIGSQNEHCSDKLRTICFCTVTTERHLHMKTQTSKTFLLEHLLLV